MANFEDIQRKYNQLITSQNNIIDMIASYGVGIDKDTPFQQYHNKVQEAVSKKYAGQLDGATPFELDERDFSQISPLSSGYYFIRRYAFYRCPNITRVVVPSHIQSIETYAFNNCAALTEVVLKGDSKIQAAAFASNAALQKFYLPDVAAVEQIPQLININAFTSTPCNFIVPNEASKIIYTADSNWNTFADRFVVEEATV
jgi:hypothetical protein